MPRWLTLALALIALIVVGGPGASLAQTPETTIIVRPGDDPQAVARTVEALRRQGHPVQIRHEAAPVAPAPAAPGPAAPAPPETLLQAFRLGLAHGLDGLTRLPGLVRSVAAAWTASPNNADGSAGRDLLLSLGASALAGALVLVLTRRSARRHAQRMPRDFAGRLGLSAALMARDALALGVFAMVGAALIYRLLPGQDFAAAAAHDLHEALTVFGVYWLLGRFLLAPQAPERRLLPIARPAWHGRMLLTYGLFGPFIVTSLAIGRAAGGDQTALAGWFLLTGTLITALKIAWFWGGRHDIAGLVQGEGGAPSLPRRVAAQAAPAILVAVALTIWILGRIAAFVPEGALWGAAAGVTQNLILIVPILAGGVAALCRSLEERHALHATPIRQSVAAVARTLLTGLAWLLGLVLIAQVWGAFLMQGAAGAALRNAVGAGAALVVGWAIWTFLKAYFDAHAPKVRSSLPGEDDEGEVPVQTRLATVLPLVRNLALGAIVGVTGLVVLSGLGLDIGPLLAGFGVLGLAISFGSQALVRDVVSGIFFMADDAFRIGEYIDTGRLKGTVEKITLRSVQLRHQNGQVHTIPFGQLQAITNFSRDWATVKFTIRLDREADIEAARKAIKKLGQAMLADPEFGGDFLLPLKMQGIQDIQENAIVVRCKFTAKPSRPSYLQRECLKRIHRALSEAGIPFASNAVMVRSASGELVPMPAASGAAAAAGRPALEPLAATG